MTDASMFWKRWRRRLSHVFSRPMGTNCPGLAEPRPKDSCRASNFLVFYCQKSEN